MSWDFNAGGNNGGGSEKVEFTKFPEGITRVRIVDDVPFTRWTHWQQKHKRSINCPGMSCPICEIRRQQKANKQPYTQALAKRVAIHVINRETGRLEIMENSPTFFQDIKDFMDDLAKVGQTLKDVDLKIRRRGTTKDDTTYRVDLHDEYPLTIEEEALLAKRRNLKEFFVPHTNEQILRILNGEAWEDVMKSSNEQQDAPDTSDEEVELK